jgi:hypothetical protein
MLVDLRIKRTVKQKQISTLIGSSANSQNEFNSIYICTLLADLMIPFLAIKTVKMSMN